MRDSSLRQRVFSILEDTDQRKGLARTLNILLISLITINVLAVALETVEVLHQQYAVYFAALEIFSIGVFSVEYLLRLWVSVENKRFSHFRLPRLRYAFSAMALVDLLTILPFFLTLFFTVDLRFLRVLRLLRVFKLTRYSSAMNMLLEVFREEASSLVAGFFILFVLLVLSASGAYLVEHTAQPDKFGSIPAAMWWAVATLTTVGYGDVTPITAGGKLFGALVTIIGVAMAAIPAGILASGMAHQLERNRASLRRQLREALEDGAICSREENELEQLRKSLGISRSQAQNIREEFEHQRQYREITRCPECGTHFKPDHTHHHS